MECNVCGATEDFVAVGQRPHARCARCTCLERHRFLRFLIDDVDLGRGLLDVAPQAGMRRVLRSRTRGYVGVDLAPKRRVDVVGNLLDLPFPDGTFGAIVCFHVLEHVPDDGAAIGEVGRVLAPGGVALIQVPIRFGCPTDEDPEAPPAERARRFGQDNHVRFYGDDFDDRLRAGGLTVRRIAPEDVLTADQIVRHRVNSRPVWWCAKVTSPTSS